MKSPLEQIERRLKTIIEASAGLFGRTSRQEQLARQLTAALYEQLPTQLSGKELAPDQFTIYLHPDNYTAWQQPQWMDWLGQIIIDALQDAGYINPLRPTVQLAPSAEMPVDSLRVIATNSVDLLGSTAALPVTAELHPPTSLSESMPSNAYLIVQGTQTVPISQMIFNIGRRSDNDLVLDDPRVSRKHLQIRAVRGRFILFDLNSTGGTLVNGNPISEHTLAAGDVIQLGGIAIIYGEDSPAWTDEAGQSTSPLGS
jgi:hypothetical protein